MPAAPIWMLTTPVVVDSDGLTLGLEIQTTVNGVAKVLNDAAAPYPVLAEGTYAFWVFVAKTNELLRQWILDAATALSITTRPSLANVLLKFTAPSALVPTSDGNKILVTFAPTGFAIGAFPMVITGGLLDANDFGAFWTKLGQMRDAFTNKAATSFTSVLLSFVAERQPSYLFILERQGSDKGEVRQVKGTTRVLRDGTVRIHVFGSSQVKRQVRLYEHESPMLGSPIPIATFASINVDNNILTLQNTDENGLVNVSGLYANEDLITVGPYIRVGLSRHVSRLSVKSGSPKTTTVIFFEAASANAAAEMVAGQTLFRCSEFEALMEKVLLFGYLIYHEPDDTTGQTRFKGEAYALVLTDETSVTPERVDDFFDLWEVTLNLVRIDVPELIL